jgi:hypothetical protein
MALPIKSIPTLTGKVAEDFIRMADENLKHKGTIDFTKQREAAERILIKAGLKQNNKNVV